MLEFVTVNKKMQKINQQIAKAAQTDVAILITGEKGVGKTACALKLHQMSNRADHPFVEFSIEVFNINPDLNFEALLKEAVTKAGHGTLYIDEVTELNSVQQGELLKTLTGRKKVLCRIITCATKNIEAEVKAGRFIQDLYFRLCVIKIRLPSLRERKEDVPHLISLFVTKYSEETGIEKQICEDVVEKLSVRSWPGNIYELESSIQYAFQRSQNNLITMSDLPVWSTVSYYTSDSGESLNDELARIAGELLDAAKQRETCIVFEEYKKLVIPPLLQAALEITENNKSQAAKLLGLNRNTFKKMVREYEIEKITQLKIWSMRPSKRKALP